MSKELIERLNRTWQTMHSDLSYRPAPKLITETADRIEELEREIERKMSAAAFLLKERDALQADNARLREAIACGVKIIDSYIINYGHSQVLAGLRNSHRELLAATKEPK